MFDKLESNFGELFVICGPIKQTIFPVKGESEKIYIVVGRSLAVLSNPLVVY